jgi:hypothetical protein
MACTKENTRATRLKKVEDTTDLLVLSDFTLLPVIPLSIGIFIPSGFCPRFKPDHTTAYSRQAVFRTPLEPKRDKDEAGWRGARE